MPAAARTAMVVKSDAVEVIAAICTGLAMPTRNGPSTVPLPSSFSSLAEILADCRPGMISTLARSEEHTSELQSLMRISYAVFCLKKKKTQKTNTKNQY